MDNKNVIATFLNTNGIDGFKFVEHLQDSDPRTELWARYVSLMNKSHQHNVRLFKLSHNYEKLELLVNAAECGVNIVPLLGFKPKQLKILIDCAKRGKDISSISRYIYNYKQLTVLASAIQKDIDISDISDPALHADQMRSLVNFKKAGFTVCQLLGCYPDLPSIPQAIVECINRFGVSVNLFPYLTPAMDSYKLSQIAYAINDGVDVDKLLKYKSWDWKVMEEIRIAAVEGLDITLDLTEKTTAEQAHNCRMRHLRRKARARD